MQWDEIILKSLYMVKLPMKTKVLFLITQLSSSLRKGMPFHRKKKKKKKKKVITWMFASQSV